MILEYKCPCCGGALSFDSSAQKMKCPYCDTEFDTATLKGYDEELKKAEKAKDSAEWKTVSGSWEDDGLKHYVCTSCGGEIIGDATMAATNCPFCGNPVVIMDQYKGMLKPDLVIPFKKSKEEAIAGFKTFLKDKKLLPKVFSTDANLEEVKGIYVPVWLFDARANANVTYDATRVRTWKDLRYRYTETSHYLVSRQGNLSFVKIPVDGSEKMADEIMESLEPYDFSEAVDFQTAYLAGYLADRYDVDSATSSKRAVEKAKGTIEKQIRATVKGYATVVTKSNFIDVVDGKEYYALLPVWLLHTKWQGKDYHFAMNGQTGKFVGNLPCDKGLEILHFLLAFGIAASIVTVLIVLWYLFLV